MKDLVKTFKYYCKCQSVVDFLAESYGQGQTRIPYDVFMSKAGIYYEHILDDLTRLEVASCILGTVDFIPESEALARNQLKNLKWMAFFKKHGGWLDIAFKVISIIALGLGIIGVCV